MAKWYHPCCGGSLQTWTKVIAIVQIIMAAICLYGGIDVLVSGGRMALANVTFPLNGTTPSDAPVGMMTSTSDSHFDTTPLPPRTDPLDHFNPDNNQAVRVLEQSMTKISNAVGSILIALGIYIILEGFVTLLFSVILFYGAGKRIEFMCLPWLFAQTIYFLLEIILFFLRFASPYSDELTNWTGAVGLIINVYCIWVVCDFINELEEEEAAKRMRRGKACREQKV